MKEIFKDDDIEQPKTIRNKIKLYLDNSDQWYRSKSVKFVCSVAPETPVVILSKKIPRNSTFYRFPPKSPPVKTLDI